MKKNDAGDYTVKQLIEKLKEYPDDNPIWFMFQHSNGIFSLFDVRSIGIFTIADNEFVHFVLDNSSIYNKTKRCRKYGDEISRLNIENGELKNQVSKLTDFILYKGYNLDDFNDFLVNEMEKGMKKNSYGEKFR